jgi:hypothetical protein
VVADGDQRHGRRGAREPQSILRLESEGGEGGVQAATLPRMGAHGAPRVGAALFGSEGGAPRYDGRAAGAR